MILTVSVALLVVAAVVIALVVRLVQRPARDAVAVAPRVGRNEDIPMMPGDVSLSHELPLPEPPVAESPLPELLEAESPVAGLPQTELPEPALPQPKPEPVITWTSALTAAPLDDAARLCLINDLTLLGAPWTIAILRRAHQEESSPLLLALIEAALASSGEPASTTS